MQLPGDRYAINNVNGGVLELDKPNWVFLVTLIYKLY